MSKVGFKAAQQINSDFCVVSNLLHYRGTEQSCLKLHNRTLSHDTFLMGGIILVYMI